MIEALFSALAAALALVIAALVRHARSQRSTGLRVGSAFLALVVIGACWLLHESGGIVAGVVFVVVLVGAQLLPNYPGEAQGDSAPNSE